MHYRYSPRPIKDLIFSQAHVSRFLFRKLTFYSSAAASYRSSTSYKTHHRNFPGKGFSSQIQYRHKLDELPTVLFPKDYGSAAADLEFTHNI